MPSPAFELVVVVTVEQVVLAIVLVVQHRLDRPEPGLGEPALGAALAAGGVSVLAPFEQGIRQLGLVIPGALIDQRLQPGAVSARLRTEDAIAGAVRGVLLCRSTASRMARSAA